ncbi:MAG TPA: hypothetical protein VIJ70_10195 [Gaiellaceae bacterium]
MLGLTAFATSFVVATAGQSTRAAPAGAATARASVARERIDVRGAPFFPIMLIDQCTPAELAHGRALGINLVLNESCSDGSAQAQLDQIQQTALAVLPIAKQGARGRGLVGWTYPDEPEGNGWTPAKLASAYPYRRGNADGLLSFVTTGSGFYPTTTSHSAIPKSEYAKYARLADVAGFDLYPLSHCNTDLSAVYNAQRAFDALAGSMPTFQWIETGPIKPSYCGGFAMKPAELRAEVWLAIAGGARGIGYFTHTWSPEHRAFDVLPSLQHELTKINRLISAMRPALTGTTVASGVNSSAVKVVARAVGNTTYVIAVNAERLPITVQLHVPRLVNGPARVFGEQRTLSVSAGRINDYFPPLGVHIYVQSPG